MKKIYKRPELIVVECTTTHFMTLSKGQGEADPDKPVLSREWDTWDD